MDKSFKDWSWHTERQHKNWLLKEAARVDQPTRSEKSKKHIRQIIRAVKDERIKFRRQFAQEFRFTQRTLVKGIKYVRQTNSFFARLVWKERASKEDQSGIDSETQASMPAEPYFVEKEEEMRVDEEWIINEFGSQVVQHVINMRQTKHWNEVPRDVEVFLGKKKILRVRYVRPQTRMILDIEKLMRKQDDEDASTKGTPQKKQKQVETVKQDKLRPLRAKRLPIGGTPPKIARKSLVDVVQESENDSEEDEAEVESLDKPLKAIVISDKWIGKTEDGHETVLEEQFVRMSFGKAFTNELKNSNRGFVDIPVGDSKPSHLTQHPELKVIGAPKIKFVQSEGKDLCVSKSLASAFDALGWKEEAEKIDLFGEDILQGTVVDVLEKIKKFAATVLPTWLVPSLLHGTFDWKKDLQPRDVLVGVLQASDGSCSHAVTIHGGFVFDANERVALPLCDKALNYCTSTEKVKSTFVRFKRGVCFRYHGQKKARIARLTLVDN
jgi:hypothetical protein